MDSMIERIARALAVAHATDPDGVGPQMRHAIEKDGVTTIVTDHMGPLWKLWENDARAAIEAMQESIESSEFIATVVARAYEGRFSKSGETYPVLRSLLRAFFDAALNEGSDDAQG